MPNSQTPLGDAPWDKAVNALWDECKRQQAEKSSMELAMTRELARVDHDIQHATIIADAARSNAKGNEKHIEENSRAIREIESNVLTETKYREVSQEVGSDRERQAAKRNRNLMTVIAVSSVVIALLAFVGGLIAS